MTAQFFEVNPTGSGLRPMADSSPITAGIAMLSLGLKSRTDSKGRTVYNFNQQVKQHLDSHHGQVRARLDSMRNDDFTAGMGAFNPEDLTHKMSRVLEEAMPPLTSEQVLPVNTEVPPGALNYRQARAYSTGEAKIYRGGNGRDIPAVGIGQAYFTQPVVYICSKFEINWLEQMRNSFGGLDTQTRKMRAARRVIAELENRWAWAGSEAADLYGILNHPYVDELVTTVTFDSSSSGQQLSRAMSSWANYAEEQSGSTFQPDTMAITPALYNYIANERFASSTDRTVLEHFQVAHPHIRRVVKCRELAGAGPNGEDGIVFMRSGSGPADSSMEKVMPMPTTLLAPEVGALSSCYYLVRATGGVNQREVGDNLVVWVPQS